MKIFVEGYFSDLDLERKFAISDREEAPANTPTRTTKTSKTFNPKNSYMQKFKNYINHSRSPWCLTTDNQFTGSLKTLQNFVKSFEKYNQGVKIHVSEHFIEGEYIPVVDNITYSGGDK